MDYISKKTEKEFTELTNEGFLVQVETMLETKERYFSDYKSCSTGKCNN